MQQKRRELAVQIMKRHNDAVLLYVISFLGLNVKLQLKMARGGIWRTTNNIALTREFFHLSIEPTKHRHVSLNNSNIMMQSLRIITQRPIARAPTAPYLRATTRFSSTDAEAEKTTLAKADLVAIVAKEYDISVAQSTRILDTVLDTIVEVSSIATVLGK